MPWNVRALAGDTVEAKWNVRAAIGDTVQAVWNVLSNVYARLKVWDGSNWRDVD